MIFKPDTIRAVVLDIHGGGWILGEPANDADLMMNLQELQSCCCKC